MFGKRKPAPAAAQADRFNLAELAAEAAQQNEAERAARGPINHQDAVYGCHGSHGSRSVR